MQGMVHKFLDTFSLCRRDRHDRQAEYRLHLVDIDGAAVAPDLIHHIEGQHHRDIEFHELHGEVEVALYIAGIHDVDDACRLLVEYELTRDYLFRRIRGEGIDAGEICDPRLRIAFYDTIFAVNGHAREIAYMLVGTGQLIEKGGLAAILVAGKGEGQNRIFRERSLIARVVLPAFSESGMGILAAIEPAVITRLSLVLGGTIHRTYLDACGISLAQCESVTVYEQFHRIAKRRQFGQRNLLPRDHSHVKKMLSQRAIAPYGLDNGRLTCFKLVKCHLMYFVSSLQIWK